MTYLIIEANVFWNPTSPGWTVQEYFRVDGFVQVPFVSALRLFHRTTSIHSQFPHGIFSVTITVVGFDSLPTDFPLHSSSVIQFPLILSAPNQISIDPKKNTMKSIERIIFFIFRV